MSKAPAGPPAPPGDTTDGLAPSASATSLGSKISESEILNYRSGAGSSELQAEHELRLKSMVLTDYAPRPSFGRDGRQIEVLANMFQARFGKTGKEGKTIYHYDVEIVSLVKVANQKYPASLLKAVWDALEAQLAGQDQQAFAHGAYDGQKNFFTPTLFNIEGEEGTPRSWIVTLLDPEDLAAATAGLSLNPPGPPPAHAAKGKGKGPAPKAAPTTKKETQKDEDKKEDEEDEPRGRRFRVTIKHVASADLQSIIDFCEGKRQGVQAASMMLTAVMCINVLLRVDPSVRFCQVGSSGNRFFTMDGSTPISDGGVVGRGFVQSFRYAQNLPAIQLDTAYSAFLQPGPLTQVMMGILGGGGGGGRGGRGGFDRGGRGGPRGGRGGRPGGSSSMVLQSLSQAQLVKLKKILKMCKFHMTHRNPDRIYTIMSITLQGADQITFMLASANGRPEERISVAEYYRRIYNITLRYPRLPCVQSGTKNYVPFEVVYITPFNSLPPNKLTNEQTADMIRVSARPPLERRNNIIAWRQELGWSTSKIRAWNILVDMNMIAVNARVLNAPQIMYNANQRERANGGAWNLRGKKFVKPNTELKAWAVVSLDPRIGKAEMQRFVAYFVPVLGSHGCRVSLAAPPCVGPYPVDLSNPNAAAQAVNGALKDGAKAAHTAGGGKIDPQLVLIILPGKEAVLYESVKRVAFNNLFKPIVTQCLQGAKISSDRGLDQYCGNVAMKVHAKLGGVTHRVNLQDYGVGPDTMLVGADVTHPTVRSASAAVAPSVAVSVATRDGDADKYFADIALQEGRTEIIEDFSDQMEKHMKNFQKATKKLPASIIIYRDGVSEGQYAAVVQQEAAAVRQAAARFQKYAPKLTFIIAAKRHNMRFFAKADKDVDKSGNLPAGTVVDNKVTHPYAYDFYLQAHAGLVGTARPTHYTVLIDENKFTPDRLQALTNALCYSFARATRSVSLIPVCYYADIICTQARALVYDSQAAEDESSATGRGARPVTAAFNKNLLRKRMNDFPAFNEVSWYM